IAWAVGIAVFLRSFVIEAYKIPSGSMLPTLEVGDHIFVNKFLYGFQIPLTTTKFLQWRHPHRGEVIVFKYPNNIEQDYIKRVIGEPGDVINVEGETLYVNGKAEPSDYVADVDVYDQGCYPQRARLYTEHLDTGVDHARLELLGRSSMFGSGPWTVPEGNLFVMGDNRDNSADSRTGFTVPYSYVKGRAMFVWLSWDSCGSFWPFQKIRVRRMGEVVR
ncbi:MAG TPA: signal peptidase I, partial [bacterium]|nr:signal peptidase I [bacterium]